MKFILSMMVAVAFLAVGTYLYGPLIPEWPQGYKNFSAVVWGIFSAILIAIYLIAGDDGDKNNADPYC